MHVGGGTRGRSVRPAVRPCVLCVSCGGPRPRPEGSMGRVVTTCNSDCGCFVAVLSYEYNKFRQTPVACCLSVICGYMAYRPL